MDLKKVTAPCGIDCFNCEIYEKNVTSHMQDLLASKLGVDPGKISCKGCRESGCIITGGMCETKSCAQDKGIEFCLECKDFPCKKLLPVSDGAERYPHNYKLYNLCRIKLLGFDRWTEEALENRKTYFKGKFRIGTGPKLKE